MKYLIEICFIIVLLQSCANNQTSFQKSFDTETGKEVRPTHPLKSGVSSLKLMNKSDENVLVQISDIDTIALANSTLRLKVMAKDSLRLNGVVINYEILGRNKYRWVYPK